MVGFLAVCAGGGVLGWWFWVTLLWVSVVAGTASTRKASKEPSGWSG
ncbi:hypothetical protein HMPREF0580_0391 [Mobiluncus mulieris ATCC 35239]|uniref:Uncharacterized protein n=1 Tax=Mobiluncus mulieris ATCC 35239 TaxID=871571 RepID=E0QNC7_9ACTO|nr:hypothetical protein HMPREF0580_0391 [Mobiluncus mulieris ATCC 35239]